MLHTDGAVAAVEIAHLAGADMGRPDREPRPAAIDQIEIDQLFQRLLQRRCRVIAGPVRPQHIGIARMRQRVRPEEAGDAVGDGRPVGELLVETGKGVAEIPDRLLLHPLPEFLQARQPLLGLVARDQAGIDRPDRSADDPVRLDAGLVQRLVDAGLVGAERSAALQHQHDLARQALAQRAPVRRIVLHIPLLCARGILVLFDTGLNLLRRFRHFSAKRRMKEMPSPFQYHRQPLWRRGALSG
jgi:hypothetical protein